MGVLGGISKRSTNRGLIAFKPTSSITTAGKSIDVKVIPIEMLTKGRHDPCVGVRATPIAEAMLAIVLMDHFCVIVHRMQTLYKPLKPIAP